MVFPPETMRADWDLAVSAPLSPGRAIYDSLGDYMLRRVKEIESGRYRINTSVDGTSVGFSLLGGAMPDRIVQAWGELRWMWRNCQRNVATDLGVAASTLTEQQVKDEVEAFLDADWSESYTDFSEVQLPNTWAKVV